MTVSKKNNTIAWILRITVAVLFIVSAIAKLSKSEILDSPYFAISTFVTIWLAQKNGKINKVQATV